MTKQEAIERLVTKWSSDQAKYPGQTSIILEHRNDFARLLNDTIHTHRLEKGEVGSSEFECETFLGTAYISCGDRLQFRKNDPEVEVTNGQLGTITSIEENLIRVRLDTGGEREFNPREFHHYQLGYAGTIHKSQGKTVDRAYALHSPWMNRNLFYVSTTRHRKSLDYFVAKEECSSIAQLKYQALRAGGKQTTQQWRVEKETLNHIPDSERSLWKKSLSKLGDLLHQNSTFYRVDDSNDQKHRGYKVTRVEPEIEAKKIRNPSKQNHSDKQEEYETHLTSYFDAEAVVKHCSSLKREAIKRGGEISSEHPLFQNWQLSLDRRDALAHQIHREIPKVYLEKAISPKELDHIESQAQKYIQKLDKALERSTSDEVRKAVQYLTEHVEEICYRIFPEGPTLKNSNNWRFRSNHSLSIPVQGSKVGTYYDFVKGKGGSLLTLVQQELNLDVEEACRWTLDLPQLPLPPPPREVSQPEEKWVSLKPPEDTPALTGKKGLMKQYREVSRYPYRDRSGDLLYYVVRLENLDDKGKKITPPLSYGHYQGNSDEPFWRFKAFQQEKKSLYHLELLDKSPNAQVLLVEGEKAAEAASHLFPKTIVMTWPGGASAVCKADWTVLQDRSVIIWPDHDEAGFKASDAIAKELRTVGVKNLKAIRSDQLRKFPEKWDLADPLPKGVNYHHLNQMMDQAENLDRGPIALFEKLYPIEVRTAALRQEFLYRVSILEKTKGVQCLEKNGLDDPISRAFEQYQDRESSVRKYVGETLGVRGDLLESITTVSNRFVETFGRLPLREELAKMVDIAREIEKRLHERQSESLSQNTPMSDLSKKIEIEQAFFSFEKAKIPMRPFQEKPSTQSNLSPEKALQIEGDLSPSQQRSRNEIDR